MDKKVSSWCKDVEKLSKFAMDEPQLALTAFNVSMSKRWQYVQRPIQNTSSNFLLLEDCIPTKFIPAIIGRNISDLERRVIELPLRYGGLGGGHRKPS